MPSEALAQVHATAQVPGKVFIIMALWKQQQQRSIPGDENQCFLSSGRIFPLMSHNASLYRRENKNSEEQVRPASHEIKDVNVLITSVIAVFYQR